MKSEMKVNPFNWAMKLFCTAEFKDLEQRLAVWGLCNAFAARGHQHAFCSPCTVVIWSVQNVVLNDSRRKKVMSSVVHSGYLSIFPTIHLGPNAGAVVILLLTWAVIFAKKYEQLDLITLHKTDTTRVRVVSDTSCLPVFSTLSCVLYFTI